jgi:hypothetical protein
LIPFWVYGTALWWAIMTIPAGVMCVLGYADRKNAIWFFGAWIVGTILLMMFWYWVTLQDVPVRTMEGAPSVFQPH